MNGGKKFITVETVLYLAIAALAAWLRLANLGFLPLTNSEAVHALTAASVTPSASPFLDGEGVTALSPAYHTLTASLFHLIDASDAGARFFPAMAGLALVLVPILIRRRLGHPTAVTLSLIFAISPVLVTTSRTAGGASLASLGLVTSIALLMGVEEGEDNRKRIGWAGAALGLSLASGATTFQGLLAIGVAVIYPLVRRYRSGGKHIGWLRNDQTRWGLWIALGVMVAIATGFGFYLSGVAGLADSLADWITGWGATGEIPALTALAMVPIYEPLVLLFGIIGAYNALREGDSLGLAAVSWASGGLLVMLAYPARVGSDLIWVIIPLATLAARSLVSLVERIARRRTWQEFIGLTCLLLILMAYAYLQLAAYASGIGPAFDVIDRGIRLWMFFGVLFLIGVVLVLFGLGWSWSLAGESAGLAVCMAFIALNVVACWRLNFPTSGASAQELWRPQVSTQGMRLMVKTLETISQSHTGRMDALGVKIYGEAMPSLAWALRSFPVAGSVGEQATDPAPAFVTREGEVMPVLSAEYTGQGLKIGERWGWDGVLPADILTWWVLRQASTQPERWILFVRLDIASLGEMGWSGIEVRP